jgi:hypothetical protein
MSMEAFVDRIMEMDRLKARWDKLHKELLAANIAWKKLPDKPPDGERAREEWQLCKPSFYQGNFTDSTGTPWIACVTLFDVEWQGGAPGQKRGDGMISGKTGITFRIPPETAAQLAAKAEAYWLVEALKKIDELSREPGESGSTEA